ncbi:hypothetical protein FDP41_009025 [Naegleria fowleri]|uniref:Uncharacterized protein n=1 Tax=Naegleria fowleri TaxID=5763 RepID=A0A6A5BDJ8_NAEFO|nr:uncharacterized protein FDP41_009025 [Naegleria fowleri]KAF0972776.1 hypothetical protein FDP41_009025 [Naegleria fowleri]
MSYRDAVALFPPKTAFPVPKSSTIPKKQSNMNHKRPRTLNYNHNISLYFDVTDSDLNDIINVTESRTKVIVPSNRRNVIQVFTDNLEDYETYFNSLHDHIYQKRFDCILSPSNFQASEHTLMCYTTNKTKHYKTITSLLDLIFHQESHSTTTVMKLPGFEEFRSLEQIRNEIPDTLAECNFGPNFSEGAIKAGVQQLAKRANVTIQDDMIQIVKQTNQRIGSSFYICKVKLASKQDLRCFINTEFEFKTKNGHLIAKRFISSIDYISAKIERNASRFPSINTNYKKTTLVTLVPTISNTTEPKKSVITPQNNTKASQSKLIDRVDRLEQQVNHIVNQFSQLHHLVHTIANNLGLLNPTAPVQTIHTSNSDGDQDGDSSMSNTDHQN